MQEGRKDGRDLKKEGRDIVKEETKGRRESMLKRKEGKYVKGGERGQKRYNDETEQVCPLHV